MKQICSSFDQYGVQAYICGHEHDLQVIRPKDRFTTQFLTGAGSEVRPTGQREGTLFAAAEPGFMAFTIAGETMLIQTIQAKNGTAKLLKSITIKSNNYILQHKKNEIKIYFIRISSFDTSNVM
ncbi:hypothetical protein OKW96_11190 [Sphingobacterium sp. KU25419]|nr:hypothetical protein OKW96_11190 [Sphingobacterium sp. KU25419]